MISSVLFCVMISSLWFSVIISTVLFSVVISNVLFLLWSVVYCFVLWWVVYGLVFLSVLYCLLFLSSMYCFCYDQYCTVFVMISTVLFSVVISSVLFSVMFSSVLAFSGVHFLSFIQRLNCAWNCSVLPTAIRIIWLLASDAVSTVSLVYNIRAFLMSVTFACAFCDFYSKLSQQMLKRFILLLSCCFVTVNSTSWHFLLGFIYTFNCFMIALLF